MRVRGMAMLHECNAARPEPSHSRRPSRVSAHAAVRPARHRGQALRYGRDTGVSLPRSPCQACILRLAVSHAAPAYRLLPASVAVRCRSHARPRMPHAWIDGYAVITVRGPGACVCNLPELAAPVPPHRGNTHCAPSDQHVANMHRQVNSGSRHDARCHAPETTSTGAISELYDVLIFQQNSEVLILLW